MRLFNPSLKHGVRERDAIQAGNVGPRVEDLDDDIPSRQLRLGSDTARRPLETVVLVFDSGNEVVIHTMKARPQLDDLLPWRRQPQHLVRLVQRSACGVRRQVYRELSGSGCAGDRAGR